MLDSEINNPQLSDIDATRRGFFLTAVRRVKYALRRDSEDEKTLGSSIGKERLQGKGSSPVPSTHTYLNQNSHQNLDNTGNSSTEEFAISLASEEPSAFEDRGPACFAEPPQKQSMLMSIFVGVFVAVGGFLFGYDTGLINSITDMNYVKIHLAPNHIAFTTEELAVLVSFLSLGTFCGALSAPFISDSFGRKVTILFSTTIIFSIGNSLQVAASSMGLLIAGRVISGLGVGLISVVVPLYQAEATHKSLRGAIISTYQWAITWGLLVSSAVSQGTHNIPHASSYRIPIGLQYVWTYILAAGMLFLPESPRYYVLKDQLDKAAESLAFLRGVPSHDSGLLEELVEIKATYDYEASFGRATFWDCFKSNQSRPKQPLRMFTGIAIQALQQFSGINFIFYYGVGFFSRTGLRNNYLVSFITYAVNVVFNIPGMFLVDYVGRRRVLLVGGIFMTLSNFIIAIVGVSTRSVVADKVMISFICLFISAFSATWGGAVWVISAELYPLGIRSKCTAICAAANWLVNFICAFITPYIVNKTGTETNMSTRIFFIWGSLNALAIVVVYFTVFETKGLTLEEIDELYSKSSNSIASTKWNREIRKRSINFDLNSDFPSPSKSTESLTSTSMDNRGFPLTASNLRPVTNIGKPNIDNNLASENMGFAIENHFSNTQGFGELDHNSIEDRSRVEVAELENGLTLYRHNKGPPSTSMPSSLSDNISNEEQYQDEYLHEISNRNTRYSDDSTANHSPNIKNFHRTATAAKPVGSGRGTSDTQNTSTPLPPNSYVDLGNGLELNTYNHGPPSLLLEESDDSDQYEYDAVVGGIPNTVNEQHTRDLVSQFIQHSNSHI